MIEFRHVRWPKVFLALGVIIELLAGQFWLSEQLSHFRWYHAVIAGMLLAGAVLILISFAAASFGAALGRLLSGLLGATLIWNAFLFWVAGSLSHLGWYHPFVMKLLLFGVAILVFGALLSVLWKDPTPTSPPPLLASDSLAGAAPLPQSISEKGKDFGCAEVEVFDSPGSEWQVQMDSGKWIDMDGTTNTIINDAMGRGDASAFMAMGRQEYDLVFATRIQKNTKTGKERPIREKPRTG